LGRTANDMKKLRAALQVKAQAAVHGAGPKCKLDAGVRVKTALLTALQN
jgi:hypothetical protein